MRIGCGLLIFAATVACETPTELPPPPTQELEGPALGALGHDVTVVDRIEEWNAALSEEDRRAKYCKMAASPHAFLRGTNHLFWQGAWSDSRIDAFASDETKTWLQGDLHVANLGAFDNDDGDVVYDLNDFDEALIGDVSLDLWRIGTSVVLVARENANQTPAQTAAVVEHLVDVYVATMVVYAVDDSEDSVAFTSAQLPEPLASFVDDVAAGNSRTEALDDWTIIVDDARVLDLSSLDLEPLSSPSLQDFVAAMPAYGASLSGGLAYDAAYFAIKSAARRLNAGTGSLGTPRYYLLIEGPTSDPDDDRILDVKFQGPATSLYFAPTDVVEQHASSFDSDAYRHATAYKALADDVDDHLGVLSVGGADHSVRERSVFKKSFDVADIGSDEYLVMAATWARIVATAHARADADFDPIAIAHSVDGAVALLSNQSTELSLLIRDLAIESANRAETNFAQFLDELAPQNCPPP